MYYAGKKAINKKLMTAIPDIIMKAISQRAKLTTTAAKTYPQMTPSGGERKTKANI
jgi:hypothetical protein